MLITVFMASNHIFTTMIAWSINTDLFCITNIGWFGLYSFIEV